MDIDAIAKAIFDMLDDLGVLKVMDDKSREEILQKIGDIIEQMG